MKKYWGWWSYLSGNCTTILCCLEALPCLKASRADYRKRSRTWQGLLLKYVPWSLHCFAGIVIRTCNQNAYICIYMHMYWAISPFHILGACGGPSWAQVQCLDWRIYLVQLEHVCTNVDHQRRLWWSWAQHSTPKVHVIIMIFFITAKLLCSHLKWIE
jgi:hypothetical protein